MCYILHRLLAFIGGAILGRGSEGELIPGGGGFLLVDLTLKALDDDEGDDECRESGYRPGDGVHHGEAGECVELGDLIEYKIDPREAHAARADNVDPERDQRVAESADNSERAI